MQNHPLFHKKFLLTITLFVLISMLIGTAGFPHLVAQAQTTNLALNRPTTCSPTPQFPCAEAVDGNTGTRWASAAGVDPQFIQVDLGATYNISRVVLIWETAYASGYQVQVSGSASGPWTNIYTTTTGNGATDDLTGLSGSGRFVRMNGTVRATQWGYSLWTFEVYGTAGAAPTATRTNTPGVATATRTRTPTPVGPTATRTRTPTRTATPGGPTATRTATRTNTPVSGCGSTNMAINRPASASTVSGANTAA